MIAAAVHEIPQDVVWPRDEDNRYRVYTLDDRGRHTCERSASDPGGVGAAIFDVAAERAEHGQRPAVFGVYDAIESKWIATPWAGGRR